MSEQGDDKRTQRQKQEESLEEASKRLPVGGAQSHVDIPDSREPEGQPGSIVADP